MSRVQVLLQKNDAIIMTPTTLVKLSDVAYFNNTIDNKPRNINMLNNTVIVESLECWKGIVEILGEAKLTYNWFSNNIVIPKTSLSFIAKDREDNCVLHLKNGQTFSISQAALAKIQEDMVLNHTITESLDTELSILKRENDMMRAHIQFMPDGSLFLDTVTNFKARAN